MGESDRVLVVGDESMVPVARDPAILCVRSLAEARRVLAARVVFALAVVAARVVDGSGLDLLPAIRRARPARVLLVGRSEDPSTAARAHRLGVELVRSSDRGRIDAAIDEVRGRARAAEPRPAVIIAAPPDRPAWARAAGCVIRERGLAVENLRALADLTLDRVAPAIAVLLALDGRHRTTVWRRWSAPRRCSGTTERW